MKRVVTVVGVLDGVHLGHQALLSQAAQLDGELAVLSFDPHPGQVLFPDQFAGLLTLPKRRAQLFRQHGADRVEFFVFNQEAARQSPEDFVEEQLIERLGTTDVVVGTNFRFGHKAAGNLAVLRVLGEKHGFAVHEAKLTGDGTPWSSTRIREALSQGDLATANRILTRAHRLTGIVVHGDHRGRELGFPTANLDLVGPLLVPADGVYSALLWVDGEPMPAAVSIGTNPTFTNIAGRRIEAHVIGSEDLDLYGEIVDLDFVGHIRPMQAFAGVESLIAAMHQDLVTANAQLADYRGTAAGW